MTAPTPSSPDPDRRSRSARAHDPGGDRPDRRSGPEDRPHGEDALRKAGEPEPYAHDTAPAAGHADGGAADAGGGHGADGDGPHAGEGTYTGDGAGPRVRREVLDAALCALLVAVLGIALGLLWLWLAPRVPLFTDGKSVYLKDPEGEEAVGADGVFVLIALGFGVITGAAVFLRNRRGGVGLVVGLTVGALIGSVLAWRLGVWLGPNPDVAAAAKAVGPGKTFDGPLRLQAKGALLAWPVAALAVHLALMGTLGKRDPEPPLEGTESLRDW